MSQLQTSQITIPAALSKDQMDLVKRTIASGATDDELALFLHYCNTNGFDPLSKDVYFRKNRNPNGPDTISFMTSIDTLRARAEATGQYAGNDDPVFDDEDSPKKASVTVWKIVNGVRCPFTASARWDQYYPSEKQGFMWRKMPHLMLGKCAEALALRKAFPKQLGKLYVGEEMQQSDRDVSETKSHTQTAQERLSAPPVKAPEIVLPAEFEEVEAALGDDTPANVLPNADYKIEFGKNKGKALADIEVDRHISMVKWLVDQESLTKKPVSGPGKTYLDKVCPYIRHLRPNADLPF